jgi:hypothetical protein
MIMVDIKFEIKETVGVLSESAKGWTKELNLVSWNDRDPKYDIREWSPEHDKMGKGVTLSKEELKALKQLLDKLDLAWCYHNTVPVLVGLDTYSL